MRLRPRALRQLSIGARLTLAYSTAMFLTVSVTGLVVFLAMERKIHQEARLILRYYAAETLDELDEHGTLTPAQAAAVLASTRERLAGLDPSLRPSLAIFDGHGAPVAARGVLAQHPVPIPASILDRSAGEAISELDLGSSYPHLVSAVPSASGFVEVAIYTKHFERNLSAIRRTFAFTTPWILLLTAAAGWRISRRALRPLAEITATARRITGDELDAQVPVTGSNDELDQLAVTLNDMIGRIRSSMNRLRRVSADAAHQLRSPLAALRNRLEVTLETEADGTQHRADLEALLAHVVELSDGVSAMLQLARSEAGLAPGQARPVDLPKLLDSVIGLYAPVAEERQISLQLDPGPPTSVSGDLSWLGQLVGNLVDNAIRYTDPGGSVEISLRRAGREAVVRVADTGRGIAPEELERVFERFHRGNLGRESSGFGLGLPVAREIAHQHGGRIEVQSRPGAGSAFSAYLPVDDAGAAA